MNFFFKVVKSFQNFFLSHMTNIVRRAYSRLKWTAIIQEILELIKKRVARNKTARSCSFFMECWIYIAPKMAEIY